MDTTVAQMTAEELKELIGSVFEQKLVELLGDSDEGLQLKKTLRSRLKRQQQAVAEGERGERLEDVLVRLGLS